MHCNTFTVIDYFQCWKLSLNQHYHHQLSQIGKQCTMHITYSLLFSILLKKYRELDGSDGLILVISSAEMGGSGRVLFLKLYIYRALELRTLFKVTKVNDEISQSLLECVGVIKLFIYLFYHVFMDPQKFITLENTKYLLKSSSIMFLHLYVAQMQSTVSKYSWHVHIKY